jgi:outer membrane protein insertion porin family
VTETSFSRYLGSGHVSASLFSFHPPQALRFGLTPSTPNGPLQFASLTARTGLVVPLDPAKGVWFGDRLFSGGSTSVRGWRMNALGPRDARQSRASVWSPRVSLAGLYSARGTDERPCSPFAISTEDSLGGNVTYAIGASLFSPLPGKPEWPLKVHTFVNVGSLASLPLSSPRLKKDGVNPTDVKQALAELARPSVSVGAGLVYEFAPIRIELGFTLPLVAREGEGVSKGWALGMGMEFL